MAARNHSEDALQIAIVEHLKTACPHLLFTHIANQGRNAQQGAKLKRMGVLAGAPDLVFWHGGWFGAIELKTGSSLSDAQKSFRDRFIQAGGKYATCKSVKSVIDILIEWGVQVQHFMIKEPPPPITKRYEMAMDFFKP